MQWIRRKLTYANTMATIAVFLALGGTSIAAVSLSKNSVGAKQIKNNAVRAAEINRNAVGASEIRSNAVAGGDIADSSIGSLDIGDDAIGSGELATDSAGSGEIIDGSVGSAEVTNGSLGAGDLQAGLLDHNVTVQFEQHTADLANGAEVSIDVHCPAGQTAIGGGVRGDLTNSELTKVTASRPVIATDNSGAPADNVSFTGWRGTFVNENNGAGIRPEVWVVCLAP